ncbi:MAG: vWA domain-containing protein [Polyangiales bacterium]
MSGSDDSPGASSRDASTRDAGRRDAASGSGGRRDASSGGGGGGGSCETQNITARANPPDILIVLDRSLSMQLSFRWAPSTAATKMLTSEYENVVQFGLMTFPSGNSICDPGQLDVPVAPTNASAINSYIDMTLPTGFTPTAETLKKALEVLGDRKVVADSVPTPANVLLVTDGEPQCPGGPDQRQGSIDAVTALADAGIKTYVVGYDLAGGGDLMNQLAQVGGTDRYYEVQNQQDLSAAFAEITKDIVRCEYELAEEPDDPSYVRVTIDGETVELNAADGWLLDGKKITLQSGSCDILKDGANHALQVKVECDPVIYL